MIGKSLPSQQDTMSAKFSASSENSLKESQTKLLPPLIYREQSSDTKKSREKCSKVPKIYISFLPTGISQDEVRNMFRCFGTITWIRVDSKPDGFTFAYIIFEKLRQAKMAISNMHKKQLGGRLLNVAFANVTKPIVEEKKQDDIDKIVENLKIQLRAQLREEVKQQLERQRNQALQSQKRSRSKKRKLRRKRQQKNKEQKLKHQLQQIYRDAQTSIQSTKSLILPKKTDLKKTKEQVNFSSIYDLEKLRAMGNSIFNPEKVKKQKSNLAKTNNSETQSLHQSSLERVKIKQKVQESRQSGVKDYYNPFLLEFISDKKTSDKNK